MEYNWKQEDILDNKYQIKLTLPEGEMGQSYQVEHFLWDEILRLKRFSPSLYPNAEDRKKWESFLQHWVSLRGTSRVVNALHVDEIDGFLCLITEYEKGESLRQYRDTDQLQDFGEALDFAIQVAEVLDEMLLFGISHGSLKLTNIFVMEDKHLKIGDFTGPSISEEEGWREYCLFLGEILFGERFSWENFTLLVQQKEQEEECEKKSPAFALVKRYHETTKTDGFFPFSQVVEDLKEIYEVYAESSYKAVIESSRFESEYLNKPAYSYLEKEEYGRTLELWFETMKSTPPSTSACWNWHLLRFRQGMENLDQFVSAISSLKEQNFTRVVCAKARLALEMGILVDECQQEICSLDENEVRSLEFLRIKGDLLFRVKKFSEAKEIFQNIVSMEGSEGDDWYRLGAACFALAEYEQADQVWEEGAEKNASHALLGIGKAMALFHRGELEETEALLKKVNIEYPKLFSPALHMAEFLAGEGVYKRETSVEKKAEARIFFQRALEITPNIRCIRGYRKCTDDRLSLTNLNPQRGLGGWSQIQKLSSHENLITALALSPDGKMAALGDCEKSISIWNIQDQSCLRVLDGHEKHITDLALSLDGKFLVSGSWDRKVCLWEIDTGKLLQTFTGHQDKISSVSISSDGAVVISGSWDGTVKLWDITSGEALYSWTSNVGWITDAVLSPDGKWLIYCDEDEEMLLVDIEKREQLAQMQGSSILFSQEGDLAISTVSHGISIWELPAGKFQKLIPTPEKEICLGVTRDNSFLLTKNEDETLKVWYLPEKMCIGVLNTEDAVCAALSYDGRTLVSGHGNSVHVWEDVLERSFPLIDRAKYMLPKSILPTTPGLISRDIRKAEVLSQEGNFTKSLQLCRAIQKIPGYERANSIMAYVHRVARKGNFLSSSLRNAWLKKATFIGPMMKGLEGCWRGNLAVVAHEDNSLRTWNLRNSYPLETFSGHRRTVTEVALSSSSKQVISSSWDKSIRVWDLEKKSSSVLGQHPEIITSLGVSKDGSLAISGDRKGLLKFWDVPKAKELKSIETDPFLVNFIAINQGNNVALSASRDGNVRLWNLDDQSLQREYNPHRRMIISLIINAEGNKAVSASRTGDIFIWSPQTSTIEQELIVGSEVTDLCFAPGEQVLISSHVDGKVRFWELDSGTCCFTLHAHNQKILSMRLLDDYFLVTSSEDGFLMLFELDWEWTTVPKEN